jgi:hypothetical protein
MAIWAPIIILVVTAPVRWLEGLLRADGANHSTVHSDPGFTYLERVSAGFAIVVWLTSGAALMMLTFGRTLSTQGRFACVAAIAASIVSMTVALVRWRGSSRSL